MNKVKKASITDRLRNAWAALRGKPCKAITFGLEVVRCEACDYYRAAHLPAETAENTENTEKAPTWTDGPLPYFHEITYMDDLVLVVLYEATEDGPKELARSHGHIIHEGVEGIAQAASYAMRGVWCKVQGAK